ncbi:MAG TPA: MFS transporter [Actinomycetota bacterium]|nr:MFS transporter [Actinomycetota bacterium]
MLVNAGYLAVTTGESLLAPVFPIAARELGLDLREAGLAFALLALSIAIGNLVGGLLLWRRGPRPGALIGLGGATVGALLAASSGAWPVFLVAQVLLGLGSGVFFAAGLSAAGALGGDRRGLAMGFFGVAFSGGLALAALLIAVGGSDHWRAAFAVSAAVSAAALAGLTLARLPGRAARAQPVSWKGVHRELGIPLAVGGMAAASQYGTVSFLPSFAVQIWGLSPAAAAVLLAVARVGSIPGKVSAGHRADRRGGLATAGQIGVVLAALGIWWTLVPWAPAALWAAVGFAAVVSALGPVANVLALDAFSDREILLGVFRSAQIGLGAVAGALLGAFSPHVGLRPTLAVAAVAPLSLGLLARGARRRPVGGGTVDAGEGVDD